MAKLHQFESVFRSALRSPFDLAPPAFARVLLITDLDGPAAEALEAQLITFTGLANADWQTTSGSTTRAVEQLLATVEAVSPDLIITWRNVHTAAWQWPHSLGPHVDILTQASMVPVLLIPHPEDAANSAVLQRSIVEVMAVTNQLDGDGQLVNHALAFAPETGRLVLAHVEDDATFARYMTAIGKITEVDADHVRPELLKQLLKDARNYAETVAGVLATARPGTTVATEIGNGHQVNRFRELIDAHEVDLLVMHSKDADHDAMHGLAWPLAVELRHLPLLML